MPLDREDGIVGFASRASPASAPGFVMSGGALMARRLWVRLTCNWLVIGTVCACRGHDWRTARIASLNLTTCGRCGRFRGYRR